MLFAALGASSACSSDDAGGGGGGTGGLTDAGSGGFAAGVTGGTGGAAGSAGSSGAGTGGVPNPPPKPTPADIMFTSVNPLAPGEQLLFADWDASPNTLSSILPDGTKEQVVFRAYRLWSVGVTPDGSKIAFASGDPKQEQNYGLKFGDSIQHTWVYDAATQTAEVLAYGNINDECHLFNADASKLYVCRRYDFVETGSSSSFKGYQLGRLTMADGKFEFLTPVPQNRFELHPTPLGDESTLLFTQVDIVSGSAARSVRKLTLADDSRALVLNTATLESVAPDGTKMVYRDHTDGGKLYVADIDGQNPVRVTSKAGTDGTFSPDGLRIAYLYGETQACSHIEIVKADGSDADTPTRVRDCGTQFITDLEWIKRP
jgi:Tol biopolymer transport system component